MFKSVAFLVFGDVWTAAAIRLKIGDGSKKDSFGETKTSEDAVRLEILAVAGRMELLKCRLVTKLDEIKKAAHSIQKSINISKFIVNWRRGDLRLAAKQWHKKTGMIPTDDNQEYLSSPANHAGETVYYCRCLVI